MDNHEHWILTRLNSLLIHSMSLTPSEAKPLVDAGFIEWVPPVWGGAEYAITEKGRDFLKSLLPEGVGHD